MQIQHILNKIIKTENLQDNLSKQFGAVFEKDWINRLWVVLNPNIQNMTDKIGSNQNSPTTIYQYNKDGSMSNSMAIEKWIMDNLNVAQRFMTNNNMFEIVTYDLKKLDGDENYLFVIYNIMLNDLKYVLKKLLIIAIVALVVFLLYILIFQL